MNALSLIPQNAVVFNHNQIRTNSQKVAEAFGKRHGNVLRGIQSLECSKDFTQLNFELSEFVDSTGRKLPMWEMTKDGFMFLVMGFTGKEAARIKEAYINAFNAMAEQLSKNEAPQKELEPIDVRACLLDKLTTPTVQLPADVQKVFDAKAWALGHEAYELCREHLLRRLAYECVSANGFNSERALHIIDESDLGHALTHHYHERLRRIALKAQDAMILSGEFYKTMQDIWYGQKGLPKLN